MNPQHRLLVVFLLLSAAAGLAQSPAKDPLEDLHARWLSARARAVKPLDDAYLKQLQEIKIAETKKGNLEGALRADKMIKDFTEQGSSEESAIDGDTMRKGLDNSMWKVLTGIMAGWSIQLKFGGEAILSHADGSPGWGGWQWRVSDDGKLTMILSNNPDKPLDVKISKKLDRMSYSFGGGTTMKRVEAP